MDIEQVRKLAELARLEVPEAELAVVAADMDKTLSFVDEIQSVAVDGVSTTTSDTNVFRDDAVAPLTPAHDLVEAAALHQDYFVKVPKVIGE